MKTPAIVFAAKNNVIVRDLDVPPPREHEVQVRSTYSTISTGTESWLLRNLLSPMSTRFPSVPGYQRSGIIVAVGSDASEWRRGDRVLALAGASSNPEVAAF